ncbi:MAG: 5'/3'-nucleotidase SurE [Deltaproteobacteria bacterium]|nr:5'/3'-nucleotidase SurE [Deltaproteobacteria bacterium]
MTDRPLILLSNDDGYDSAGILALRDALDAFADVVLCAPRTNQSAASHALTLHGVLRLLRADERTFALNGTPADCVYVALHSKERILPRRPDMVVSGMNHGPNLGSDVVYSGTVAAAREGALRGIPAVAVSSDNAGDRTAAARIGASVVRATWDLCCSAERPRLATLLNVNVPVGARAEPMATRLGARLYDDVVDYRLDPRGHEYLWIGGSEVHHDLTEGTDTAAWEAGIASVTPLAYDLYAGPDAFEVARAVVSRVK